jgi:hypothetical protein
MMGAEVGAKGDTNDKNNEKSVCLHNNESKERIKKKGRIHTHSS